MRRRVFNQGDVETAFPNNEILEKRGKGGFKDVFLAKTVDGDDRVIKIMPLERRQWEARARRESDAMEKISSPVFVNLHDYYKTTIDGTEAYVIIEEFVPGKTLEEVIEEGNYGLDLGINVLRSILDVLEETPDYDIVHRDIKPSNIMVTPEEDIRLLDVGIVRFNERESLTPDHASRSPHTPKYGAPEQLNNLKDDQDVRTDLFAAGIVFFETVTGEHPFVVSDKSSSQAILDGTRHTLFDKVDNPEEDEKLFGDLQFIFHTLTQPDLYRRYPDASEVKTALQDALVENDWEVHE